MNHFARTVLVIFFVGLSVSFSAPATAQDKDEEEYLKHPKEYTIQESYDFFSRERTKFAPEKSKLTPQDVKYLEHLFFVTDLAFKARVNMMQYFFTGMKAHKKYLPEYVKKIEEVIQSFSLIEAPSEEIKKVQEILVQALEEQRDFFKEWSDLKGGTFVRMRDKYKDQFLVQSSHMKLQKVYTELMLIYPDEDPYNHKAFYNHLAALDFQPWK